MEQNLKELLLRDLCARLPYGVIVQAIYYDYSNDEKLKQGDFELGYGNIGYCFRGHWMEHKPYLRPMLSMTEEEAIYYDTIFTELKFWQKVDWLNKHHFDFRGLIEKGLALPAPDGMYDLNKK